MKKTLALILALVLAVCCAAALAEGTEESKPDGVYAFHNASSLVITSITLTDNSTGESASFSMEGGMKPDDYAGPMSLFLNGKDGSKGLTLEVVFENGETAKFETLHYEDVMIDVLDPVDVTTGATPIAFYARPQIGQYWFKNATGGTVKNLTVSHNAGDEKTQMVSELPADGEVGISLAIPADANGEHCLTVSFTVEDGTEYKFETLSIEKVGITLKIPDADAVTGATPIAFGAYPEE